MVFDPMTMTQIYVICALALVVFWAAASIIEHM